MCAGHVLSPDKLRLKFKVGDNTACTQDVKKYVGKSSKFYKKRPLEALFP